MHYKKIYSLTLISLVMIFLTNCTASSPLAGGIDLLNSQSEDYFDGIGSQAKFGEIIAIGVDTNETIYVADKKNNAIRTIDTNGVIKTLIGENSSDTIQPESLRSFKINGLNGLTVYRDTLYFISDGCIRRVQVNRQIEEQKVEYFFGYCRTQSEAEITEEFKPLGYLSVLKTDSHGNLYAFGDNSPYSDQTLYHISEKKTFRKIPHLTTSTVVDFAVDSKGFIFSTMSLPFEKTLTKNGESIKGFESPGALAVTQDDSLYVRDLSGLILYLPDGTIKKLGYQVDGSQFLISQNQNFLYSASKKTVYRTSVPKH